MYKCLYPCQFYYIQIKHLNINCYNNVQTARIPCIVYSFSWETLEWTRTKSKYELNQELVNRSQIDSWTQCQQPGLNSFIVDDRFKRTDINVPSSY